MCTVVSVTSVTSHASCAPPPWILTNAPFAMPAASILNLKLFICSTVSGPAPRDADGADGAGVGAPAPSSPPRLTPSASATWGFFIWILPPISTTNSCSHGFSQ